MGNYNYYTPTTLALELLRLIPCGANITSVADICCGTWNLLKAARACFSDASIVGVDTDPNSKIFCLKNATFCTNDGRDFADQMEQKGLFFDLILSNPPFGYIEKSDKKYLNSENVLTISRRYESELLFANYKLLKDSGYLLAILPITFIKGRQYQKHRIWIAEKFDVLNTVLLPSNTFGAKELNTAAILLKKGKANEHKETIFLSAKKVGDEWSLEAGSVVSNAKILSGNWDSSKRSTSINNKVVIHRGNISSQYFAASGRPVLHCSSMIIDGLWIPAVRYCCGIKTSQEKYAEAGDVIINRIGKCAACWSVYTGPQCLVSDCVIIIKQPEEAIISRLKEFSRNGMLTVPKLGVSASYITSEDVKALFNA